MELRPLSTTGLRVSRACFGTMTFGAQCDEPLSLALVEHCLDQGVNFFDTANIYNAGAAETILGRAFAGRRDRVVLASKAGGRMGPDEAGLSRAALRRALEASLRRLRTEYLDLYYLHLPDPAVPLEETLEAMGDFVREGKVRHVASSNYAAWQMCRLRWLGAERGLPAIAVSQPMYNLIARGIEQEFLPMCREFDIATVVYNPLAGGLLTGKQRFEAPLAGTRFDGNRMYLDRYWHEQNFSAVHELAAVAQAAGRSLVSVAINWLLHHTPTDSVILGASKLAHLEENLRAFEDGPLPADTLAACDRVWARLRGPSPKYNR